MKKQINQAQFNQIKAFQEVGIDHKTVMKLTKIGYHTIKKAFNSNTLEEYKENVKATNLAYKMKKAGKTVTTETPKVEPKVFDETNTIVTQLKALDFSLGLVLGRLDKLIQLQETKKGGFWK